MSKENLSNHSFLVNSTENDTLYSDTIRHKNLDDQFEENTVRQVELQESFTKEIKMSVESAYSVLNNPVDYLVAYVKESEERFYDLASEIKQDGDSTQNENLLFSEQTKNNLEKLLNVAIMTNIDHEKLYEKIETRNEDKRYVLTYIYLNLCSFLLKKKKSIDLSKILKRARDQSENIRILVLENLVSLYEQSPSEIFSQFILSLRDPKKKIQEIALDSIRKIFSTSKNSEDLAEQLELHLTESIVGKITANVADFLYEYYESISDSNRQCAVAHFCSNQKVSDLISKFKAEEKNTYKNYHLILKKCNIEVFRNVRLTKKQKDKYFEFILKTFKQSEKCCFQETCHLKILNILGYSNLEKIFEFLQIIKENKNLLFITIDILNQINIKIFKDSDKTVPIIRFFGETTVSHTETLFVLLKKLESDFEIYINEILPKIEHVQMIGYFNTPPQDNVGILWKGLWLIKEEKFDEIEKLEFFEYKGEPIEKYRQVLQFIMDEIRKLDGKTSSDESKTILAAIKTIFNKGLDHVTLHIDQFPKNIQFYSFLIHFLCYGYLRRESVYLHGSLSNFKVFIKKCTDLGLLVDIGFDFLVGCTNKKGIKEISTVTLKKLKKHGSLHIFTKMKDLISKKVEMMNLVPFIDILTLDERIILENMADGAFKEALKSKCTE